MRYARTTSIACVLVSAGLWTPGNAQAAPSAPATPPTTVIAATFNVCKVDCAHPAPAWDVRRERVARVIAASSADVIGLQEATNNPTSAARTQAEDIANLAAPLGYATPRIPAEFNACKRPRSAAGQLEGPSPCDNTASILYRTATIRPAETTNGAPSAGITTIGGIAPGADPENHRRSVMWAYLQTTTGTNFLALSLHTDNAKTPQSESGRVLLGKSLAAWVEQLNVLSGMEGTQAILMADLNSYQRRQPAGAQAQLVSQGWVDAHTAKSRRNIQYSTINYNPLLGNEQGFPLKPYKFRPTRKNPKGEATRIDYVMGYGTGIRALDYEVVIRLRPGGEFDPEYQASDHQMVRAVLALA